MGMRFLNNPRTVCQYFVVLIVSCSLLLRVLSVGYLIGGLTIKFRDPLLSNNSLLQFINDMFLGILRIGSLLNALILLPIAAVVVNICNAAITYFGICKRKPHCLKISAVISLLLVVFYTLMVAMWSWILGELYDGVKGSFVSVYQQNPTLWNERWIQMKCCDVEKPTFGSLGCYFADGDGCFDVFANTITTYGSSYIAVLVVNILAEIVMIVGIEYLHRLQLMLDVTRTNPGRPIETKELHNIRNGIVLATCASWKTTVKKNTSASLFGVMSLFSSGLDGSVVLAIVFLKYNLYDISLTEEFYQITGAHNINLGYTGGALWITAICSFICSMIAKIMCFVGIFSERKWLFVMHIITEVITLLVECIMLVFAALIIKATICCFWKDNAQCAEYTYPTTTVDPFSVCDYWTNSGSIFFSAFALVLILHIILKIILIMLSNEVFLKSKLGQLTEESNQNRSKSVGIFTQASLAAKRFPMVATAILISTIICIVDCLYFCGLLIVRYGSSSYPFIEVADVLSAIRLGPRTMTENRDNAIFIGLTSLSVSFFLQLGKFAAYYLKSSRIILLILWSEILVVILQLVSVSFVTTALKLVYCCFNSQDCVFSYGNGLTVYSPISYSYPYSVETMLCDNEQKVWERVMLQSWLMFGFGMLCIFLQILSMIFGYKYFKKSLHGELGIFRGLLDIFRSLLHKVSDNRYINEKKMPNYSTAYGLYCILSAFCLVLEVSFAVSLYAYYFTEGNATFLLNALDLISYYQNNFNPIYQGVTISSLVIVPLAAILRIASFVWFWLRRSEVPLYTILIFIPIWSLGEIVLLCYASSVLRLAYGCMDFDLFTFDSLIASQSTICAGLGKRLYIQSGVIVAYLVMHIIFDVAIFVTLGMMQPFVMKNKYKQYVWGVFQNAIKDFRKNQTTTQRFFLATQMIPLVFNFIFWIGLILMGLIPGYIHTGFLDHLTSYLLSVSSMDIKTAVLGILYSLIAVVPIYCTLQVIGAFGLFKRNGTILKVLIISTAILCIADIIYLVFTSDIVHFRRCFCEEEFTCLSYNTTSTEDVHQNVCGNLFLDASSVLITYIIITLIVHILALVLGIKILKGLRVGKVGIVNASENRHTKTEKKSSPANRGKGIETKLNGKKQEDTGETVSRNELQSLALNTEIEENKQEVNVVEEIALKSENTVVNRDAKISEQIGFGENERRSEKENVSVPDTEKDVTSKVQEDGTSGNELTLPMTEEGLSTQRDDDSEELMLDQELQYYNELSTKAESGTDSVFSQTSEYGQTTQNTDEKLIKQRHDDTEAAIVTTTGAGMQEEM